MDQRWINGREILKRWNAQPFELLNAFKNGLPPHLRKTGEILVYEGPLRPAIRVIRDDKKVWRDKSPLGSPYNSRSYLITDDSWLKILLEWRLVSFKLADVMEFEKIHSIDVEKMRWLPSTDPHFNAENSAIAEGLAADTTINSEEYFPELNINILKMQAERWIKKFSEAPIKRVLLYNFSSKYEGTIIARNNLPPHPAIYAIVFEVGDYDKTTNMNAEDRLQYDLMGVRGERQQESYERLLGATKPNKRIEDNEQYCDLMTKDFAKVYKNPPKHDYRGEWQFYCIFKNTYNKTPLTENVRTDEPHIVLWLDWGDIQAWAKKAHHNGHIDILKLCHILAFDQESSASLPALWQAYEIEKGLYPLKTDSFNERIGAWFKLMSLWTTGYNGIRYDDDITCIKTGCCEGGSYVDDPANKGDRVNLQVLKDYFANTLLIPTPLPQILFPEDLINDSESAAINETDYYFILKGDYWSVGFERESQGLNSTKGLKYVVALLKNPNHEFYPLDLLQVVEGVNEDLSAEEKETRDNYTKLSQKRNDDGGSQLQSEEHLSLKAMPIERLFENEKEREWFEEMINEVWERTTENDSKDWEELKTFMLNEKGVILRYTPRGPVYRYLSRLNDESENARKAISNNIKNFKEKIKDKMPSLKNHLDIHLKTGNKFKYTDDPTAPISWKIED